MYDNNTTTNLYTNEVVTSTKEVAIGIHDGPALPYPS